MTYGELRTTRDVDVVASLRGVDVPRLLARFPLSDFYHDQQAALEAVRTGGEFNIIDNERGLKIDVFVRTTRSRIGRSRAPAGFRSRPAPRPCSRRPKS